MADSLITLSGPRGTLLFRETAASTTLEASVFGKTAAEIYAVKVDASQNPGEDVYLCLYSNTNSDASQITVGTTEPFFVLKCAAGSIVEMVMPCGISVASGHHLHAAVKQSAGIAGTTAPTGTVAITLLGA
jgi:hypothetical protein